MTELNEAAKKKLIAYLSAIFFELEHDNNPQFNPFTYRERIDQAFKAYAEAAGIVTSEEMTLLLNAASIFETDKARKELLTDLTEAWVQFKSDPSPDIKRYRDLFTKMLDRYQEAIGEDKFDQTKPELGKVAANAQDKPQKEPDIYDSNYQKYQNPPTTDDYFTKNRVYNPKTGRYEETLHFNGGQPSPFVNPKPR